MIFSSLNIYHLKWKWMVSIVEGLSVSHRELYSEILYLQFTILKPFLITTWWLFPSMYVSAERYFGTPHSELHDKCCSLLLLHTFYPQYYTLLCFFPRNILCVCIGVSHIQKSSLAERVLVWSYLALTVPIDSLSKVSISAGINSKWLTWE